MWLSKDPVTSCLVTKEIQHKFPRCEKFWIHTEVLQSSKGWGWAAASWILVNTPKWIVPSKSGESFYQVGICRAYIVCGIRLRLLRREVHRGRQQSKTKWGDRGASSNSISLCTDQQLSLWGRRIDSSAFGSLNKVLSAMKKALAARLWAAESGELFHFSSSVPPTVCEGSQASDN